MQNWESKLYHPNLTYIIKPKSNNCNLTAVTIPLSKSNDVSLPQK